MCEQVENPTIATGETSTNSLRLKKDDPPANRTDAGGDAMDVDAVNRGSRPKAERGNKGEKPKRAV